MAKTVERRRWNPWRLLGWGMAAGLLLLPLVAMQFTDEVVWDAFDFVFMGVLLGGVGVGLEFTFRRSGDLTFRIAAGVALATGFLLLWGNAAVGIIAERDEVRVPYVSVVAVALIGATLARFRPAGLARAMSATALAQASLPVILWAAGLASPAEVWSSRVAELTGFFVVLWMLAAVLFLKVARARRPRPPLPIF